jgi:hypothetical protein
MVHALAVPPDNVSMDSQVDAAGQVELVTHLIRQ